MAANNNPGNVDIVDASPPSPAQRHALISKRRTQIRAKNPRVKGKHQGGGRAQMFSHAEMKAALENTAGHVTLVAAHFNVTRQVIYDYMERYPDLKEIRNKTKRDQADLAASKLFQAVQRGEQWAILETLRRYGKYLDAEWGDNASVASAPQINNIINVRLVNADRSRYGHLIKAIEGSD